MPTNSRRPRCSNRLTSSFIRSAHQPTLVCALSCPCPPPLLRQHRRAATLAPQPLLPASPVSGTPMYPSRPVDEPAHSPVFSYLDPRTFHAPFVPVPAGPPARTFLPFCRGGNPPDSGLPASSVKSHKPLAFAHPLPRSFHFAHAPHPPPHPRPSAACPPAPSSPPPQNQTLPLAHQPVRLTETGYIIVPSFVRISAPPAQRPARGHFSIGHIPPAYSLRFHPQALVSCLLSPVGAAW